MKQVTLYGLNKNGSFKVWNIEVFDRSLGCASIVVGHGSEGGKITNKVTNIREGKNIGRANETTPYQQAVSEAEGKINKQKDKGYRENKADLSAIPMLPMLAHDYRKQGHRIVYPCYTSVKLDGLRCLAECTESGVTLKSRGGKFYDVPHVLNELQQVMKPGDVFDGELYFHGAVLEEIASAVKRTDTHKEIEKAKRKLYKSVNQPQQVQTEALKEYDDAIGVHLLRQKLVFLVFDIAVEDVVFTDRLALMEQLQYELDGDYEHLCYVRVLSYDEAKDEAEMKQQHARAVLEKFEGIMLRNAGGVYESGKRSADLQKYKEFLDEEFLIVDYEIDKDGCIVHVCKNNLNDETFTVIYGSHEEKRKKALTPTAFNGKMLTVKFQTRYKDTLLPQFPTGVVIRDYE
ncbi:DNA ligase [Pseudomonas phage vB_PseuGesM_254]|uniref:DNA ligase n=1 Tax=Pseudomonas phage vB_PseuGesM_254 TaxID=3092638 RepID=A0AAX4G6E9_9CAUD|nr:DNA ligase [Pseudomonas phage PseuGes_254]